MVADESNPAILCRRFRHFQLLDSLDQAFDASSQQEATLNQPPLFLLSQKSIEELANQTRSYIPLDIFREQTLDFEPFHLINGPGVV
jgi:hypothetical protein